MGLMYGVKGSEVRVRSVSADDQQPNERTTTYVVTFSCGCRYSETRDNSVPARIVGSRAVCYASHEESLSLRVSNWLT